MPCENLLREALLQETWRARNESLALGQSLGRSNLVDAGTGRWLDGYSIETVRDEGRLAGQ